MIYSVKVLALLLCALAYATAFTQLNARAGPKIVSGSGCKSLRMSAASVELAPEQVFSPPTNEPLLLRAAKGQKVDRPPVWMMRQAGRHMKIYRDLVAKYPTFRERSEIPDVSTEISLQPYNAYKTDGVILFSDILTPLPAMGVDFDIKEKEGPVLDVIYNTMEKVKTMHSMDWSKVTFVEKTLKDLRKEVGDAATVLGFVGCPYTLATYMVEGKSSKAYLKIKKMMYEAPEVLHAMLENLADCIGEYANFQIASGAQVIQVFDSWAGELGPLDYDTFAHAYQQKVIRKIKAQNPDVPVIIYIKQSGSLLEKMAKSGADIVSLDWTVTVQDGRRRIGEATGIQGNLDPAVLYGPHSVIKARTEEILQAGKGYKHVMNLGHGIEATTPEENAKFFIDTVKAFRY